MKQCVRIIGALLVLMMGDVGICRSEQAHGEEFLAGLRREAKAAFAQHDYVAFLKELDRRRSKATTEEEQFYVTYYQLLAQSSYLDHLEQNDRWKEYYALRGPGSERIIATVRELKQLSPVAAAPLVDVQFLAWRAYRRQEDAPGAAMAFAELGDMLFAYLDRTGDLDKWQEIVDAVAQVGALPQVNTLLERYREHVLRRAADASSPEELRRIADQYFAHGDMSVAAAVYESYARMVLAQVPQTQALLAIREIINRFVDTGFRPAPDADFAEELYALGEEQYGPHVWGEQDLFMRAVNLELSRRDIDAVKIYQQFSDAYPESELWPEAQTRRGFILMFRLEDPLNGVLAWEEVSRKHENHSTAFFCRYWAGVYWHGNGRPELAQSLLGAIPSGQWPYGSLAHALLHRVDTHQEQGAANDFYPFALMFNDSPAMPVELTLAARPSRIFMGQEVAFEGGAQDFSAGTVQPRFSYEWFGQLGQAGAPGNVFTFTTSYQSSGPQIVWMAARTENTQGATAELVWNYTVHISLPGDRGRIPARTLALFSAAFEPSLPDLPQLSWVWEFTGPAEQSAPGRDIKIQFDTPGVYTGRLRVGAGERSWERQFTVEVVP